MNISDRATDLEERLDVIEGDLSTRMDERGRLLRLALVSLEKYRFPTMIPVITAIKKELYGE